MERDRRDVPVRRADAAPAPSTNLTTSELEAVIRRAAELQAGSSARAEEGVSEAEVVKIGQELGLEPAAVRRAIAEVRSRPAEERGALVGMVGERVVRTSRVVQRPAATVAAVLDRYLREKEYMVAQRRFHNRTRYVRNPSIAAGIARFASGFSRAHPPLDMKELDVAVSRIDEASCIVEVGVDMGGMRGGLVAGLLGSSSAMAVGWSAAVLATPIADVLLLLGIPLVGGAWLGMRAIYGNITGSVRDKLESLLDRLEHNELG
ncbi:MAG: hypothetical protein GX539_14570 [Candidatus Cloacimonetes bacterium]|jgi:hypothetical protein|nr:hypothetical protein [Candidatus Cloacimonadota bacterium]